VAATIFPSTGIYSLENSTPDKTPLVLVHGLISDPGDFHVLINDLAGDEEVRRRYQVWIFYYPTSFPVARCWPGKYSPIFGTVCPRRRSVTYQSSSCERAMKDHPDFLLTTGRQHLPLLFAVDKVEVRVIFSA
jgi:hypothetical protein